MNGRINWINHMDSSMLSERILKLLLQPVIENAVLHGVQENPGRTGTVILTGVRQENDLVFTVEDDGHGMSEAQIKSILEVDTKGYGVYNVNQRIKLYYGDDYGLSYESEPGKGTRAIIRLRHLES
jgi:two-component system sensor histidine kinase YesM